MIEYFVSCCLVRYMYDRCNCFVSKHYIFILLYYIIIFYYKNNMKLSCNNGPIFNKKLIYKSVLKFSNALFATKNMYILNLVIKFHKRKKNKCFNIHFFPLIESNKTQDEFLSWLVILIYILFILNLENSYIMCRMILYELNWHHITFATI